VREEKLGGLGFTFRGIEVMDKEMLEEITWLLIDEETMALENEKKALEEEKEALEKALKNAKKELKRLEGIEQKYIKFKREKGQGRKAGTYKRSEGDIEKMRELHNAGMSYQRIAEMYDIAESTARNYIKGRGQKNKQNEQKNETLRTHEFC